MGSGSKPVSNSWILWHSVVNVSGFSASLLLDYGLIIWIAGSLITFFFLISEIPGQTKFPLVIGIPNWVTIFRLITIYLLLAFRASIDDKLMFALFFLVIILDGVDGWLARRFNQASAIGEQLDMETDAFMTAVLTFIWVSDQQVGMWLIAPGMMRYAGGVLSSAGIIKLSDYPPKRIRQWIAVCFFIALTLPFVIGEPIYLPVLTLTGSLIMASFLASFLHPVFQNPGR